MVKQYDKLKQVLCCECGSHLCFTKSEVQDAKSYCYWCAKSQISITFLTNNPDFEADKIMREHDKRTNYSTAVKAQAWNTSLTCCLIVYDFEY